MRLRAAGSDAAPGRSLLLLAVLSSCGLSAESAWNRAPRGIGRLHSVRAEMERPDDLLRGGGRFPGPLVVVGKSGGQGRPLFASHAVLCWLSKHVIELSQLWALGDDHWTEREVPGEHVGSFPACAHTAPANGQSGSNSTSGLWTRPGINLEDYLSRRSDLCVPVSVRRPRTPLASVPSSDSDTSHIPWPQSALVVLRAKAVDSCSAF